MYKQVIVPTFTYGAETWGLKEPERRRLNVFEMKCLRLMVEVTRWARQRRQRNSREQCVNRISEGGIVLKQSKGGRRLLVVTCLYRTRR